MASMDTNDNNITIQLLEELLGLFTFKGLHAKQLKPFIERSVVLNVSEGACLEHPDMPSQHLYIIIEGHAQAFISALDREPIMSLGPGDVIGESVLLEGDRSPAVILAKNPMRLLMMPGACMQALIAEQHCMAINMLLILTERLRAGSKAIRHSQLLQSKYQEHANIDALTGLYNRRWINDFFKRRLSRSMSSGKFPDMSVVLIDADHFKRFNDSYGHYIGDFALKAIAEAIREHIRPTDMAARYGGEEFMLILPNTSWEEAETVAQRVREGVLKKAIEINGNSYPAISISSGITEAQGGDQLSDIIIAADGALYQAKASGRNCVRVDKKLKTDS